MKSTAIDPKLARRRRRVSPHRPGAHLHLGARGDRRASRASRPIALQPGTVMVLIGRGPIGAGMEEIYQVTSALKHLDIGKTVTLITDARFSGVSTGACIGHVGPEALAGGPIGRLVDGDIVRVVIDTRTLDGSIDLMDGDVPARRRSGAAASMRPDLAPDPAAARRHPHLGGDAAGERRHVGRLRLRRRRDRGEVAGPERQARASAQDAARSPAGRAAFCAAIGVERGLQVEERQRLAAGRRSCPPPGSVPCRRPWRGRSARRSAAPGRCSARGDGSSWPRRGRSAPASARPSARRRRLRAPSDRRRPGRSAPARRGDRAASASPARCAG